MKHLLIFGVLLLTSCDERLREDEATKKLAKKTNRQIEDVTCIEIHRRNKVTFFECAIWSEQILYLCKNDSTFECFQHGSLSNKIEKD